MGRRLAPVEVAGVDVLDLPGDPARRPLVLLHEGLGSIGLWRDTPRTLASATGRRVVAYSRPGHGRSAPPPGGARTAAFFDREADVVLPALLDGLGITAPLLVGHSDGATIALLHAARHPVGGVVAIAPHVFVETDAVGGIEDAVRAFEEGDLRARMAKHHDDPDHVFRSWSDLWLDPRFWSWTIEDEIAPLAAPLLLVHGARDHYGTLAQLDRIEAAVSASRVQRLVVDAGHSPHLDRPEVLRDAIAGFAAGLP
ncbi:alpha/beta hydrolase [Paraconexibacter algicola]|uniref:Alpha/beta hydrolase n=1 Tax=Paraconexibacter algicola TaxID=2133960 RepID=A0A2T4UK25_9ACTN|nr:alpha/beta hydrolase [Paraconexibacter algicola]